MGEIGRTAVSAGIGLAALAGVAGWLMTAAEEAETARNEAASQTASVPVKPGQPIAAGFARLAEVEVFEGAPSFGGLMKAERDCMAEALGQEPDPGAWPHYERVRLFQSALRHGATTPYAPDGTERFGSIVAAMGYDPAAAFEAGRIGMGDVQFAEAYIAKYLQDGGSPLFQGLDPADSARLEALQTFGRDQARPIAECILQHVMADHGVDLAADLERRAALR